MDFFAIGEEILRKIRKETNYIVVHCSATKPSQDIGVREIDEMHKARGWQGIGYHFVIDKNGILEDGEDMGRYGAHVKGYNSQSVGICLVGGLDVNGVPTDTFNKSQMKTLRAAIDYLVEFYPNAKVLGHRDLSPDTDGDGVVEKHEWLKECPCFDVQKWWNT